MSSSSSSSSNLKSVLMKAKRGGGLQGRPRPQPLSLPTAPSAAAARPHKKTRVSNDGGWPGPVIIYERSPEALHVRPEDFMAVVQRLTGRQHAAVLPQIDKVAPVTLPPKEETATVAANHQHLILTLEHEEKGAPLDNLLPAVLHSPGFDDGFLLSPGSFLFSPETLPQIDAAPVTSPAEVETTPEQKGAPQLDNLLAVVHSPGSDDSLLLSPGIFLLSPTTMQALHELISSPAAAATGVAYHADEELRRPSCRLSGDVRLLV